MSSQALKDIAAVLLEPTISALENVIPVQGPNFENGLSLQDLLRSYERIGFQATSFGRAVEIVNRMRKWRSSEEPVAVNGSGEAGPHDKAQTRCTVFLGYTSNLMSSGLREILLYLVKHKHVSVIVTTAGGIEEDFIKCFGDTYLGDFHLSGLELRKKVIQRIGNLVIPNTNYCKFEKWLTPIMDAMLEEQKASGKVWSPSTMIHRMGKEINNEESVYYWAYKNNIPVFCPAITDGAIGDVVYMHSFRNPGLIIDIARDIRMLNELSRNSKKAGMIILGGGVCKHQIANSMVVRGGADYAVYINTGQEYDGSDSGARPDEAVSWGKISPTGDSVKVFADATLVLPLLVAATFAQEDT
ncbi:DHS-like NAD/FAD-binding domain-containing protein [Boletus edulis BED1]|uniref:deoxyhypusine synthase n=1 Tax=Boletus edulis BED1 TaxID=1328754 RepID=A0AAD4GJT7_BOLED|nr:DHS-like NAD/FAD-binding domain-containing protein [Boletus edulis BED1]